MRENILLLNIFRQPVLRENLTVFWATIDTTWIRAPRADVLNVMFLYATPVHDKCKLFKKHSILTLEELVKPENQAKTKKKRTVESIEVEKELLNSFAIHVRNCINCLVLDHQNLAVIVNLRI